MPAEFLTKSLFLIGLQCPKYLWMSANRPEFLPEPDSVASHRFEEGHRIDSLAKSLFPDAIQVPKTDFRERPETTGEFLMLGKPLFDACFHTSGLTVKTDVLSPDHNDAWDLIEVKASLNMKNAHLFDIAFQRLCIEESGVKLSRCCLMLVNGDYVRQGKLMVRDLFRIEDVTAQIRSMAKYVSSRSRRMLSVIRSETCPEVPIGEHCSSPHDCPFKPGCWAFLGDDNPISLNHLRKKTAFDLIHEGILSYTNLPSDLELTDRQIIQIEAARNGVPHVNIKKIGQFLDTLEWPLYFLDFETYDTAIPLYDGTWPYQKVPFQFSLHRMTNRKAEPVHLSFLGNGKDDPRPALLEALKTGLGETGSIIVYNESFEKGVLSALANFSPSYRPWVNIVSSRIRDLLPTFLTFAYYHPAQNGSASIKSVLPALTGKGYDGLAIGDGMSACLEYMNMVYGRSGGRDMVAGEAEQVRADLERYCSLDTEAMILILEKLREAVGR